MTTIKFYKPKDISEILRVTPHYIQSGKLKGTKIGGGWRVKDEDFQRFAGFSAQTD